MSVEEDKELFRRWYEEGFYGDISIADEVFPPKWVRVQNGLKRFEQKVSTKDYKDATLRMRVSLPDGRWTVDQMLGEGDTVAAALTLTGTQTGWWDDNPPTNNKWRMTYHLFLRFAAGKLVEMAGSSGTELYEGALIDGTLFKEQEES